MVLLMLLFIVVDGRSVGGDSVKLPLLLIMLKLLLIVVDGCGVGDSVFDAVVNCC